MSFDASTLLSQGWPLLVLVSAAFLTLVSSVLAARVRMALAAGLACLALLVAGAGFCWQWRLGSSVTWDFLVWDPFGNLLGLLACAIGLVTALSSYRYWTEQKEKIPEFFALLLFSVVGMVLMSSTTQLLTLVFGLEVMSLSLYVLVAFRRADPESGEAGFKYFLLGAVATAFLLFGVSLFYGATGSLDLKILYSGPIAAPFQMIFKLGAVLLLLGFAFKVAAVPFHFWAPDAYDGAPAPVTGFMAAGVKVAAFGALIRVVEALVRVDYIPLQRMLLYLSVATMLVGGLAALRQTSVKRIMAYSSISHAGYLLLGVATLIRGDQFVPENLSAILFYLLSYALLTLGAFAVLTALSSGGREIGRLQDLDGLADRHPVLAAMLGLFLISLAGLPPTAGFVAKYYLFSQAIEMGLYSYAIIGILASAVSLYYYLGPVVRMYFQDAKHPVLFPTWAPVTRVLLALMVLAVFYFGIMPGRMVQLARETQIYSPSGSQAGMDP